MELTKIEEDGSEEVKVRSWRWSPGDEVDECTVS